MTKPRNELRLILSASWGRRLSLVRPRGDPSRVWCFHGSDGVDFVRYGSWPGFGRAEATYHRLAGV